MPHRVQQLEAIRAAALAITTQLDLGAVLQSVVDQARILVNARYAALGVLDEDGAGIEQFITAGLTPEERARIGPFPQGHGLLGVMIRDATPIRIPSIESDGRSIGFPPHHPPMHSLLGVPIVSKGRIFGNLYLTDKQAADPAETVAIFSAEDQETVELFAMAAAIAIENAAVHRQSEQLAIARERERFAMDLHDGIIQSIYAVGLTLDDARYYLADEPDLSRERIDKSIHDLNDVIADIRNYILGLEPTRIREQDLAAGLAELARELRANSFMAVTLKLDEGALPLVSRTQTVELLHIVKEALSNIRKHARSTQAAIELAHHDKSLLLSVTDNGAGFEERDATSSGNGLQNIRQRTAQLDGRVSVDSSRGRGTRICITVPVVDQ